jgi:hypothetical protein
MLIRTRSDQADAITSGLAGPRLRKFLGCGTDIARLG